MRVAYDRVKEEVREVEEEWRLIKENFVEHASDVCERRFVGGGVRKFSEWWNEGMKKNVDEKKRALEELLQSNSRENYERYKEKNQEAKAEGG